MSTKIRRTATRLINELSNTKAGLRALAQPQLGSSSIEQGAIEEYDEEGTLVSLSGTQFDGTHTAVSLAGPPPPMPSQPSMTPGPGLVQVRWNGKWDDEGTVSPMDFSHVSVHMSLEEVFDPDADTQVATIRGESGDSVTVPRETGEWWVSLVAVSQSGKWSEATEPVMVEVPDAVTVSDFQDAKIEMDDAITAVQVTASGKNRIYNSTVDPTPADAAVDGDRWQVWTTLDPGGRLTATWRHNGTDWIKEALDEVYLPLVNIGEGTYGELSGSRLVAKSVKADALEALLVLASTIVAGDPNGTHARMTPQGFKVLASPDGGVTPPSEVVRMGVSATDDYLSVLRADGSLAASISSDGVISAKTAAVDSVTLGGQDLQTEIIDTLPKGIVAFAQRTTSAPYWAGSTGYQPYLSLTFDAVAGRAYRVWSGPIAADGDAESAIPLVSLHYGYGTEPATSWERISQLVYARNGATSNRRDTHTFNRLITPIQTGPVSLLISYGTAASDAGRAKIVSVNSSTSVVLAVSDEGLAPPETGEKPDGSGDGATTNPPPPPSVKTYVKTYLATGSRSYDGSGAAYNYNTGYLYQGASPAGYGNLRSLATMPNWVPDLSGATVQKVEVYAYADFWYYSAGGNAKIGFSGFTSLPASLPSTNLAITSANWPRNAGRWVTIPSSLYGNFKSGAYRAVTFGGAPGASYSEYGYLHDIRVRITYTK
ncbi:MAG: hypothetical protein J7474_02930 [Arthrobacter sp.]|nr:hypothetical protein [Arthrobacter sp.]